MRLTEPETASGAIIATHDVGHAKVVGVTLSAVLDLCVGVLVGRTVLAGSNLKLDDARSFGVMLDVPLALGVGLPLATIDPVRLGVTLPLTLRVGLRLTLPLIPRRLH